MIKITQEQYNRIFASKLISESHIKEKGNDLKSECIKLIKYMYGKKPSNTNSNMLYDEVCKILLEKGLLIEKDGHYEISRKLGTPENAKEILEAELKRLLSTRQVKSIASNPEFQIITDNSNLYIMKYGDISKVPLEGDELNNVFSKEKAGKGLKDWDSGKVRVVEIDDELKNDLISTHSHDKKFISALSQQQKEPVDEMSSTGSVGGGMTPALSFGKDIEEQPIKRDLNTANTVVVAETTVSGPPTTGPYAANALPAIGHDGSYKKVPKTKAEKKTQWPRGTFANEDNKK